MSVCNYLRHKHLLLTHFPRLHDDDIRRRQSHPTSENDCKSMRHYHHTKGEESLLKLRKTK